MTAISTRPRQDSTDSLRRFAVRADASLCGALGLLVAMAADPLSQLAGLSATTVWIAGAALVALSAPLYVAAGLPLKARLVRSRRRKRLRRRLRNGRQSPPR